MVALFAAALAATAAERPMVDWVIPALATNQPQTPEEAEEGRKSGRKLPPPEVLQPSLDAALPPYQPRKEKLVATFHGGASDVLSVLVQQWFEKFRTYHPEVQLSISPPYAGSLGAAELVKEKLDFVFVSRELRPDDIKDFRAKFGYGPLSIPVCGGSYRTFGALDAVAFFVNKDNPIEKLSFDQIDAIYSGTHLRGGKTALKWGDLGLGGEWADKPIKAWGIKPWNGFEEFRECSARAASAASGATTSLSRSWSSRWPSGSPTIATRSRIQASPISIKACACCRSPPSPAMLPRRPRMRTLRWRRIR